MRIIFAILFFVFLQGCTIKQNITPVSSVPSKDICVIENPKVKRTFHDAYLESLKEVNLNPKEVPADSAKDICRFATDYTANWSWDLAAYLEYAKLNYYENGETIGEASYDARGGSGRLDKFISAKEKLKELVAQVFKTPSKE